MPWPHECFHGHVSNKDICPTCLCHGLLLAAAKMRFTLIQGSLELQVLTSGDMSGQAWDQQPFWRLQSAPLDIVTVPSVKSGSNGNTVYMALRDKSIHKYKLVVPDAKPKVELTC